MQSTNQFAATVVDLPNLDDSISKAVDQISAQLNGPIDLLFAFFSEHEPEFIDQFTPRYKTTPEPAMLWAVPPNR